MPGIYLNITHKTKCCLECPVITLLFPPEQGFSPSLLVDNATFFFYLSRSKFAPADFVTIAYLDEYMKYVINNL
jgi:hypothetical protein